MNVTLEQARAFDAVARLGSFSKASEFLGKGHTAVLYLLKTLEENLEVRLLDRSKYRTRLTPTGLLLWEECQKLLEAEKKVLLLSQHLSSGWEPKLKIVMDGVIPVEGTLRVLSLLEQQQIPTRIFLFTDYLAGVEKRFTQESLDIMISIIPSEKKQLKRILLSPVKTLLVCQKQHPLASAREKVPESELGKHVLITVRNADERLKLSTLGLDQKSTLQLGDFYAKKKAILENIGFGWLPEHMIKKEILEKKLVLVNWEKSSIHWHRPILYYKGKNFLGRAGRIFLNEIKANRLLSEKLE